VTNKVIIEGVNRVKKHTRITTSARGAKAGGIEHVEAAISASNVMVIDTEGKATRVGYRRDDESGKNVRTSRRSGKDL
jgi:large subunit ribosomal protein L24